MGTMIWATVAAFVVAFAAVGVAYLLTGGADLTIGMGVLVIAVSFALGIGVFWLIVWLGGGF